MVQNSQEPNQIDQKVHLGLILGYKSVRKAKNYQFGHFYIPNMGPYGIGQTVFVVKTNH